MTTQSVTVLDNEASFSIVNGMHAVFDYSQVMWLPWNQIKPFYLKKHVINVKLWLHYTHTCEYTSSRINSFCMTFLNQWNHSDMCVGVAM